MGKSGLGKTTLLRILMGLEKYDAGSIEGMENKKISAVFQEDRLCENLSAVINVAIVCEKNVTLQASREMMNLEPERGGTPLPSPPPRYKNAAVPSVESTAASVER